MSRIFRPQPDAGGMTEEEILESMVDESIEDDALRASEAESPAIDNLHQMAANAFLEVRADRVAAESSFEDLPAIQHMRALWESKGIHPEDPVFIVPETLALADARFRNGILRLIALGDKSESFQMALLDAMAGHIAKVADVGAASHAVIDAAKITQEAMQELHKSNAELLEHLPKHYQTIYDAAKYLGELGKWQILVNFLIPLVAIAIGFILGKTF